MTGTEGSGADTRTLVAAGGFSLRCRGRLDAAAGDAVFVYLRPENLVVLNDGEEGGYENVIEGRIERVIFEGPTAQLRVDVGGRELRADVSGGQRLTLIESHGKVRLGFNDVTLIKGSGMPPSAPEAPVS